MKRIYTVALFLALCFLAFSTTPADSLVRFKDLSFQSAFEKQAFINHQQGTDMDLCLAIDKNMTEDMATVLKKNYREMIRQLTLEKITARNIRQKFIPVHKIIFSNPSMQYYENAEFSDILKNGYFNYVTSSVLYSMALTEMNIPSFFLFTLNKTDIIINPDAEQVILEARNMKDENGYFSMTNNKGFILDMLDKNIRIGSKYQYNTTGGNVAVGFKESDLKRSNQLAATLYFYKALQRLNARQNEEAYQLVSKACYLYPDEMFINSMYAMLTGRLQNCEFKHIEDIDMLGQLSKFKTDNFDFIKNTFLSVMGNRIVKLNDLSFCTEAYNRLMPQISDVMLASEISYYYYIAKANCRSLDAVAKIRSALEALKLKPTDKQALLTIDMHLHVMLEMTNDKKSLLDTLNYFEKEMTGTEAVGLLRNAKMLNYLELAKICFINNQPKEGIPYITLFESSFSLPLPNTTFRIKIENAYYEYARYYVRFKNIAMATKIVNRGLEYIPKSNMIQTATYNIPVQKPVIIKRNMTKAEYDKYMKKNGPDR